MKLSVKLIGRVLATGLIVALAVVAGRHLWDHYRTQPWTRDGRIRADVVQVAADVAGLVERVNVRDNQFVHAGDSLFVLDRSRHQLALEQAEAVVSGLKAQIAQGTREHRRNGALAELVPAELREQSAARLEQLNANLAQAVATRETMRLNLSRTEVRAPMDGWVTNLDLRSGSYATAGRPLLTLIDKQSLHAVGYFEETKIPRIQVGAPVNVRMVGEAAVLKGHVQSIAAGIDDRERQGSNSGLANVNPTFNWVRLAQRIPVRIQLDEPPADLRLIAGRTATIEVRGQPVSSAAAHTGGL